MIEHDGRELAALSIRKHALKLRPVGRRRALGLIAIHARDFVAMTGAVVRTDALLLVE
ncbi:MAG: hypothetical protein RMN52_02350 [Anaerolineae bacterium]|nr:hypothetical protein [Candidatus Roseilinea sp.]MDW8448822.1 hypothetical protein [Anaerolineae bacterium]